jgi:hypothetical protein
MAHFAQPDRQKWQLHAQSEEQGRVEGLEPQREMPARGFLGLVSHQRDCGPALIMLILRFAARLMPWPMVLNDIGDGP